MYSEIFKLIATSYLFLFASGQADFSEIKTALDRNPYTKGATIEKVALTALDTGLLVKYHTNAPDSVELFDTDSLVYPAKIWGQPLKDTVYSTSVDIPQLVFEKTVKQVIFTVTGSGLSVSQTEKSAPWSVFGEVKNVPRPSRFKPGQWYQITSAVSYIDGTTDTYKSQIFTGERPRKFIKIKPVWNVKLLWEGQWCSIYETRAYELCLVPKGFAPILK